MQSRNVIVFLFDDVPFVIFLQSNEFYYVPVFIST